jgi:hypothetical protein
MRHAKHLKGYLSQYLLLTSESAWRLCLYLCDCVYQLLTNLLCALTINESGRYVALLIITLNYLVGVLKLSDFKNKMYASIYQDIKFSKFLYVFNIIKCLS